ncbi:hypothetical protein [Comamonas thiooxydans]|uniref:Uncharacterized protein n=1 Tax=Comamonas thiooxydans TaxID=363952 RepID=A0A0E3BKT7_9BURK|nr:hypothetical protein [Comamonas thiooxydans]KGG95552.1 hypothetical protein P245_06365 [Comamonas thiooxydans]
MSSFDQREISVHWHLCDELSVKEAALLIVGVDPASETGSQCDTWKVHERPEGYEAVKRAICNALRKGQINGSNVEIFDYDINRNPIGTFPNTTDIESSVIERDSLVIWLKSRNVSTGFFFPPLQAVTGPEYLDPQHPRYSDKLAAAVMVWQAMEDENLRRGKSLVTAMKDWLETRYKEFNMVHDHDNPKSNYKVGERNDGAIKQVAQVANWLTKGGSTTTPEKPVDPPQ